MSKSMSWWRSRFFQKQWTPPWMGLFLVMLLPLVAAPPVLASVQAEIQRLYEGDRTAPPTPGRSRGGAVRGNACNFFNRIRVDALPQDSLTALIPETHQGATVLPYPTFWFYMPVSSKGGDAAPYEVEFELRDKDGNPMLDPLRVPLPDGPAVLGFKLPNTGMPLQIDEAYHWSLRIICDEANDFANPWVYGTIKRISTGDELIYDLATTVPEDRYIPYAQNGVWYETVTYLARYRDTQSQAWANLLGLFGITDPPPDLQVREISSPALATTPAIALPSEQLAIGRSTGGAVQNGACNFFNRVRIDASSSETLIALSPETHQGTTVLGYPTFWFYLPLSRSSETEGEYLEFDLQDETGTSIIGTEPVRVPLPEEPGLVGLRTSTTGAPLQAGRRYQWSLKIVCDETDEFANPSVYGWVERMPSSDELVYDLASAASQDEYIAYAQNGIWHEMVTSLVRNRTVHPQAWTDLLKLFGLETIAEEVPVYESSL